MKSDSYSKIIDRSDFEDIELRSFLAEIAQSETASNVESSPESLSAHNWEAAMALRTFANHGYLVPRALFAGIGVGTTNISFALAANGCIAFPVDRYLEVTPFSPIAPAGMMIRPEQFSELHYPQGSVIPIHGDARNLSLPTDFFDGVYSTGLVDRLETMEEVEAAAAEIGRILKPGGIASITVPFLLEGPNGDTDRRDKFLLFTQQLIQRHIVVPSALELLGELDTTICDISFDSRAVYLDLANNSPDKQPAYSEDADLTLVRFREGYLTCPVHIALRKSGIARSVTTRQISLKVMQAVETEQRRAAEVLTGQIADWAQRFKKEPSADSKPLFRRVPKAELDKVREELLTLRSEQAQLELLLVIMADHYDQDPNNDFLERLRIERPYLRIPILSWGNLVVFEATSLPSNIGIRESAGLRSEAREGYLSYGPYVTLGIGHHRATVEIALLNEAEGCLLIDVCHSFGTTVTGKIEVDVQDLANPVTLEFDLIEEVSGVEVRVRVPAGADLVMHRLRLERREVRYYSDSRIK